MKRLLTAFACCLAAVQAAVAGGSVRYDWPFTIQNGWYVVRLDTPVGPRRFIFDTGCSMTVLSEKLCDELGLRPEVRQTLGDSAGQVGDLAGTRIESLRIGPFVSRNVPVLILPDSSPVLRCTGVSGIAGVDLLRGLTIRLPNSDSTITVADDCRQLGKLDRRRSARLRKGSLVPVFPVRFAASKRSVRSRALFDTGAVGSLFCAEQAAPVLYDRGIARDIRRTVGVRSDLGWTGRAAYGEIAVGRIPSLRVAGTTLREIPFRSKAGELHVLGADLLRRGQVVIDFRRRRFWFLAASDAELHYAPQRLAGVAPALVGVRLVVGQVWDEALADVIAPGDRIVRVGSLPTDDLDPCTFLQRENRPEVREITVECNDGTRVCVPIEDLNGR